MRHASGRAMRYSSKQSPQPIAGHPGALRESMVVRRFVSAGNTRTCCNFSRAESSGSKEVPRHSVASRRRRLSLVQPRNTLAGAHDSRSRRPDSTCFRRLGALKQSRRSIRRPKVICEIGPHGSKVWGVQCVPDIPDYNGNGDAPFTFGQLDGNTTVAAWKHDGSVTIWCYNGQGVSTARWTLLPRRRLAPS